MEQKEYDLIVVGAGSGGCATAKVAAEQGLRVLMIDKRKKKDIGNKLTFDTIPAYTFDLLGIPVPDGDELDIVMRKLKVFSPNKKYHFEADLDGFLAHRHLLGQRLLKYAEDAGSELLAEAEVVDPIIEDDFIVGVTCKSAEGSTEQFRAKVVCDASGFHAVVREKLPHDVYHNEKITPEDTVICYREVRDLLGSSDYIPPYDYPGWYCYLQHHGYFWVVPEDKGKANIGCGIPLFADHLNPEKVTIEFCESHPEKIGKDIHAKGTGPTPYLPMRACQPELVGNDFLLVGDSGYQVSTNSGFGVPGSFFAGKIAAEVTAKAIKKGNVSREGLWEYNVLYKRGLGSVRPFADAIRLLVQNMSHEGLDLMIKTGLMGSKEFSALWSDTTFDYSISERINKLIGSIPHFGLFMKVSLVFFTAKKLEKIYKGFPEDIGEFNSWMDKRNRLYGRLFKILGINRTVSA